jgi:hypothetical protein
MTDHDDRERQRLQSEADEVDVHRYAKRFRALKAIGLGAAGAGAVWLVLIMLDSRRNPCQRLRDHVCKQDRASIACRSAEDSLKDSVEDKVKEMRQTLRAQCQTRIERFKDEDGVTVP